MPNGNLRVVGIYEVSEVVTKGLPTQTERKVPRVSLRFRVEAQQPSLLRFVSLETGAAWVANYRLRLKGNTGKLDSAARLGLGSLGLSDTKVRLVSGLPNLKTAARLDLASGSTSLANFLANQSGRLSTQGTDPFDLAEQIINRLNTQNGYYYGGGFGGGGMGGGGPVPNTIDFVSYDPTDNSLVVRSGEGLPEFVRQAISAARVEDLHAYDFGQVTLGPGGRIVRTLSSVDIPLNTLYQWEAGTDAGFQRVLRLKNTTQAPWPAGQVFLESGGIPVAQVDMPFTPVGQEAGLALGGAEDILKTYQSREISRVTVTNRPDLVIVAITYEAKISVTNTRDEEIEAEVGDTLIGTVIDPADGEVVKRPRADALNSTSTLTWRFRLKPGERREWTIRFVTNV